MKKLVFPIAILLFAIACTQRGLLSTPGPVSSTNGSSTTFDNGGDTSDDTGPIVPKVAIDRPSIPTLVTDSSGHTSTQNVSSYFITSFAAAKEGERLSNGARGGGTGKNFCFSNEVFADPSYRDAVPCVKPFAYSATPTVESVNELALASLSSPTGKLKKTSTTGLGVVINALQIDFNHYDVSTAPYSRANIIGMYVKTAPILGLDDSGYLRWDTNPLHIEKDSFGTGTCDMDNSRTSVGLKLPDDLSADYRGRFFLSGLWLLERRETHAFEYFVDDDPDCTADGTTSLPYCKLFTSRARIFSSLITPEYVEPDFDFSFFPGDPTGPDHTSADPYGPTKLPLSFETIIGRYADPGTFPTTVDQTNGTTVLFPGSLNVEGNYVGAKVTPILGRTKQDRSGDIANWKKRVIVELCINGTRINSQYVTQTDGSQKLMDAPARPLVESIRAEFRSIKIH